MMPLPPPVPHEFRRAGQDGYRTPMFEDPQHYAHLWNRHIRTPTWTGASTPRLRHDNYHGGWSSAAPMPMARLDRTDSSNASDEKETPKHLPLKLRMKHVTWAYFTITMATGGIANVISAGMFTGVD